MKKRIIYMAALAAMAAASCTALEERAVLEQEPLDAVSRMGNRWIVHKE